MEKILFLGKASEVDPGFKSYKINGVPLRDHMDQKGITVLEDVVSSCHGCPEILSDYSRYLQSRVENGDRVVAALEGGLLFAKPSIMAIQTTFPIVSIPTDLVAYQGFMVPSGHAVVAGVGVYRDSDIEGKDIRPKTRALMLAEMILGLENEEVYIPNIVTPGINERMEKYGIKVNNESSDNEQLTLAFGGSFRSDLKGIEKRPFIWSDDNLDVNSWESLASSELQHHIPDPLAPDFAQVRGFDNLAIFAAKVLSLQNPKYIDAVKAIAAKKLKSYGSTRNLGKELSEARG